MHEGADGDTAKNDPRARHRDRVRQWVRARQAQGRCRCGRLIAEGSLSRCLQCLERARRAARHKRGIPTAGRKRRGRPLIGGLGDRRRAFEGEERHRTWRRQRQAERQAELRRKRWF